MKEPADITVPVLTEAEHELMQAVWDTPEPITSARIMERLKNNREWKATTVLTLLSRITGKGFLQADRVGKSYEYTVLIPEEQYQRQEGSRFFSRIYRRSLRQLVSTLYEEDTLDEGDVLELIDWFQHRKTDDGDKEQK